MRALWHNELGSALVEGAVMLPLLLVLILGVYEFSWWFYQQHVISESLRSAARHLARSPEACDTGSPRWGADQDASRLLAVTSSMTNRRPRIKGWTPSMVAVTCTPIENPLGSDGLRMYRGNAFVYVVTVSSRLNDPSLGFFRFLGIPAPIISASHSERVTGPG